MLATLLFSDIVSSTRTAAELGDRRWRELLTEHDAIVQRTVDRFAGRLVKHTGDGFLAMFDGPGRGIRCAVEVRDTLARTGLATRSGLHTGEIAIDADDVIGLGVHIAARVRRSRTMGRSSYHAQ